MQGRTIHNRINDGQLSQESLDGTWEWGRTTNDLKDDGDSHHTRASAAHPPNEDSTADGLNRLSTMNKWRGIQDERVWECEAIQRTI